MESATPLEVILREITSIFNNGNLCNRCEEIVFRPQGFACEMRQNLPQTAINSGTLAELVVVS